MLNKTRPVASIAINSVALNTVQTTIIARYYSLRVALIAENDRNLTKRLKLADSLLAKFTGNPKRLVKQSSTCYNQNRPRGAHQWNHVGEPLWLGRRGELGLGGVARVSPSKQP